MHTAHRSARPISSTSQSFPCLQFWDTTLVGGEIPQQPQPAAESAADTSLSKPPKPKLKRKGPAPPTMTRSGRRALCAAPALLLALLLGLGCSPSTAGGAPSPTETCLLLRFKDRNMDVIEQRASEAAGLAGPNAGAYLRPEQVADLSGRSEREVQALSSFLAALGGRVAQVGRLRDMAVACLPPSVLDAVSAVAGANAEPSPEQQALVAATWRVVEDMQQGDESELLGPGVATAALALAGALPTHLAGMTSFVMPLSGPTEAVGALRRPLQAADARPEFGAAETSPAALGLPGETTSAPQLPGQSTVATAAQGTLEPYSDELILNVDKSYGYGLSAPPSLGFVSGLRAASAPVGGFGIPQFSYDSLLYSWGISSATAILNRFDKEKLVLAAMLPCKVSTATKNGATVLDTITFATMSTAKECAGNFSATFAPVFAANPSARPKPVTVAIPASAVSVISCGQAVARSRGRLPSNTCKAISDQVAIITQTRRAISNATAVYVVDFGAVLPTYTGLVNFTTRVQLARSVTPQYRSFGARIQLLNSRLAAIIGGSKRPQDLRRLYNVPPLNSSATATRGLLAGVSHIWTRPYSYSPRDLTAANRAFGLPLPPVASLLNKPVFPANSPIACYQDSQRQCEPGASNIQMLTQYGAGSGARFGFAAAAEFPSSFRILSVKEVFAANLELKPLPDVLAWSWLANPPAGIMAAETEPLVAKFAAMGVSVLALSGPDGAYNTVTRQTGSAFCPQFGVQHPASSKWVTAVGGVTMARATGPRSSPQLVTAMFPLGSSMTSGGGIGHVNIAPTPTWQAGVVAKYIASQKGRADWPLSAANRKDTNAELSVKCSSPSNCTYGRGFPDISLVSDLPVWRRGVPATSGSGHAAAMAGLVMHLNAAVRATSGLENCKLGFLNPFLYWAAEKFPGAFTDVTVGSNRYSGYLLRNCGVGYAAAPGWDAATGLGVPNIGVLSKAAIQYVRKQLKAAGKTRCP